eukprot:g16522.t1
MVSAAAGAQGGAPVSDTLASEPQTPLQILFAWEHGSGAAGAARPVAGKRAFQRFEEKLLVKARDERAFFAAYGSRILAQLRRGQPLLRPSKLLDRVLDAVCEEVDQKPLGELVAPRMGFSRCGATTPGHSPRSRTAAAAFAACKMPPPEAPRRAVARREGAENDSDTDTQAGVAEADSRAVATSCYLEEVLCLPKADDLDVAERFVPLVRTVIAKVGSSLAAETSDARDTELASQRLTLRVRLALLQCIGNVRYYNVLFTNGVLVPDLLREVQRVHLAPSGGTGAAFSPPNALSAAELVSLTRCLIQVDMGKELLLASRVFELFVERRNPHSGQMLDMVRNYANAFGLTSGCSCPEVASAWTRPSTVSSLARAILAVERIARTRSAVARSTQRSVLMMLQILVAFYVKPFAQQQRHSLSLLRALRGTVEAFFPQTRQPDPRPLRSGRPALFTPDAGKCHVSGPQQDVHKVLVAIGHQEAKMETPVANTSYVLDISLPVTAAAS